jgi:hypothetical protein
MAYIFQSIANKGAAAGITPNQTADARKWYRDQATQLTSRTVNPQRTLNDKKNRRPSLVVRDIGSMFMYFYDPKTKDQLPYYDIFPMIFLLDLDAKGFLGMNLHYIPPYYRAVLMDALYKVTNNDKYDDTTKLKLSYKVLSGSGKFPYYEPCIKRYLWNHVGSDFLNVEPIYWDTALMLPLERFKKATKDRVWADSKGSF